MSDQPKTFREVNFVVQGVKEALDGKIKLLLAGIGLCLTTILAVAGGGYALYKEVGGVDSKISALQATVQGLADRLSRETADIAALTQSQRRIEQTLARMEGSLSQIQRPLQSLPVSPITLTQDQEALVRSFFKLTKRPDPPKYKVGEKAVETDLKPMIDTVYLKIAPSLKDTKFLIDQDGSLVVTAADNVVVLIVAPA